MLPVGKSEVDPATQAALLCPQAPLQERIVDSLVDGSAVVPLNRKVTVCELLVAVSHAQNLVGGFHSLVMKRIVASHPCALISNVGSLSVRDIGVRGDVVLPVPTVLRNFVQ